MRSKETLIFSFVIVIMILYEFINKKIHVKYTIVRIRYEYKYFNSYNNTIYQILNNNSLSNEIQYVLFIYIDIIAKYKNIILPINNICPSFHWKRSSSSTSNKTLTLTT